MTRIAPSSNARSDQAALIRISIVVAVAASLVAGAMLARPPWALLPIAGLGAVSVTYLALRYPTATTVLTIFLSLVAQNLRRVIPILDPFVALGAVNVRLWDPMVLGLAVAVVLKLLSDDRRVGRFVLHEFLSWALLFLWLALQIVRTIGIHGINTVGEFRTYYSQLLLVPYLAVMVTSAAQRRRLLKSLALLSFSFLPIGLANYFFASDVTLGVRVISASGALALLYGLVALLVVSSRGRWERLGSVPRSALIGAALLVLVFTAHRSVWMASVVAIAALWLLGEIPVSRQVQLVILALLVVPVASWAFSELGYDPAAFIQERLLAFTAPSQDPTAAWRSHLWRASLDKIRTMPLVGQGLGTHFQLDLLGRETITTSPHSLYLSIPVQIGLPGLLLYLAFVAQLLLRLKRARPDKHLATGDSAIVTIGLVVLLAGHAYYVAYVLDWMTWAYCGLAASVLVNREAVTGGTDGSGLSGGAGHISVNS